jgi:hypothetical protein
MSANLIACDKKEIVITDDHMGWTSRQWTATCHDKVFTCKGVQSGMNTTLWRCQPQAPRRAVVAVPRGG